MKKLLACLVFVAVGCKENASNEDGFVASDSAPVAEVQAIRLMSPPDKMMDASSNSDEEADVKPDISEQKIIREATLKFEANDLENTYSRVLESVKKYNGVVQNDEEGKDYESVFHNLTIRIPNKNFDAFLADVGKGVAYFDKKEISAEDVTEEYIDIDARLKAKRLLEARYTELLKKANKVSEMLEIEKQLSEVREEIESKEGQMRYLQSRISMSTVSVEFYKKMAAESGATISYGSKMWNAVKSGFNGISAFFIGLLNNWPFIIILVALIYFLRKRWKRKKTV